MIRKSKKETWLGFLEYNKHRNCWEIARIARDPWGLRSYMGDITGEQSVTTTTQEEKVRMFREHNLGPQLAPPPAVGSSPLPFREALDQSLERGRKALRSTKNCSSPGPDRISYRLLKLLQHTPLVTHLLHDICNAAYHSCPLPHSTRDLTMIMVPKPNKDHTRVKGWRPIVLANTMGKLADKLVAERIQPLDLFHPLQHGSRKISNATGCTQLMVSLAQLAISQGKQASLLGKDIKSAFNYLRIEGVMRALAGEDLSIQQYVRNLLSPRSFDIAYEGSVRGTAHMNIGTP